MAMRIGERSQMDQLVEGVVVLEMPYVSSLFFISHTNDHRVANQDRNLRSRKVDCEKNVCQEFTADHEKLSCTYKCISELCFNEVYGSDAV